MNVKCNYEFEDHKNAILFLKGVLVGYATKKGMKHSSIRPESEYYQKGREFAEKNPYSYSDWATSAHIIYNRLRHERPHKGSFDLDQQHLNENSYDVRFLIESLTEILGEDTSQLMEGF